MVKRCSSGCNPEEVIDEKQPTRQGRTVHMTYMRINLRNWSLFGHLSAQSIAPAAASATSTKSWVADAGVGFPRWTESWRVEEGEEAW